MRATCGGFSMSAVSVKPISAPDAPAAVGPYSCAVACSGQQTIYVSGQLPIDPQTGVMSSDIKEQTEQSLRNVAALLQSAGASLQNVVKTTVFITNMDDFAAVNEVYGSIFTSPYPARSCFEVSKLPKGAKVEIECVAVL